MAPVVWEASAIIGSTITTVIIRRLRPQVVKIIVKLPPTLMSFINTLTIIHPRPYVSYILDYEIPKSAFKIDE